MDEQLVDDATELAQVLRAAEVDASLLERFAEEALTLRLLRDMGDRLSSNLEELGLCTADATHLATVILARGGREGGRASSPVVVAQGTAVSEASSRGAAIQQSSLHDPHHRRGQCSRPVQGRRRGAGGSAPVDVDVAGGLEAERLECVGELQHLRLVNVAVVCGHGPEHR